MPVYLHRTCIPNHISMSVSFVTSVGAASSRARAAEAWADGGYIHIYVYIYIYIGIDMDIDIHGYMHTYSYIDVCFLSGAASGWTWASGAWADGGPFAAASELPYGQRHPDSHRGPYRGAQASSRRPRLPRLYICAPPPVARAPETGALDCARLDACPLHQCVCAARRGLLLPVTSMYILYYLFIYV